MTVAPRILVVDDQEEIREMTAMILAGAGYEARTAASGPEALRLARCDSYDLMLLDINMPEMDGWETLRLLRADDALADLSVVMFSVKSEVRDKVHGMQEGAVDYITKPFGVDDILKRVRRVLDSADRRSSRRGAAPPTS